MQDKFFTVMQTDFMGAAILKSVIALPAQALCILLLSLNPAAAQDIFPAATISCGKTSAGFPAWLSAFSKQAAQRGIGSRALAALKSARYAHGTIAADRGQKSFKLSFDEFMKKRGANAIISRGRVLKAKNAALFARIEEQYGVPPGPIIAIWGMETGFGAAMGKQNTLSAVATLAYDCRRSDFFTDQLYAALELIDRGDLKPQSVGAMHGEIGQTQFLPRNALLFGVDEDGDGKIDLISSKADALASTARFLQEKGWQRGLGYQEGEPNFAAIQEWNKAAVYERALAAIGKKIDGR